MRLGRLRFAVLMPKKKKQSLSHLECREAVGVDSIARGMTHCSNTDGERAERRSFTSRSYESLSP